MAITTQMRTDVSQLYVALFGRAPDGEGLGFWVQQLDAGQSITQVANTMYATAPARAYFPSFLTNGEIIASFYQNVLGRTADAEGLAFWTTRLNAPGATPGSVIAELINVVANYGGNDHDGLISAALFTNKVAVAQWYGEQNGDVAGATTILSGVTSDPATVTAATSGSVTNGQTFTLTTGVDTIVGGTGNDTINASNVYLPATSTEVSTLSGLDTIDGGAGSNTLNIIDDAGVVVDLTKPASIKNIQTLNLTSVGSVTGNGSGGANEINLATLVSSGLTQANISVKQSATLTVDAATTTALNVTNDNDVIVVGGGNTATIKAMGNSVTVGDSTFAAKQSNAFTSVNANVSDASGNLGSSVHVYDNSGANGTVGSTLTTVSLQGINASSTVTGDGVTTLNLTNNNDAVTLTNTKAHTLTLNVKAQANGYTITDATATSVAITATAATATEFGSGYTNSDFWGAFAKATTISIAGDDTLTFSNNDLSKLTTVTYTGTGSLTTDLSSVANLTTVDASGATGVLDVTIAGTNTATVPAAESVTGGSGNDIVTITGTLGKGSVINLGFGSDTVKVTGAGVITADAVVDGGAGVDTLLLSLVGSANVGAFKNFENFDVAGHAAGIFDTSILATNNTVTNFVGSAAETGSVVLSNLAAGVGFIATGDMGTTNITTLTQATGAALTITSNVDEAKADSAANTSAAVFDATNATSISAVFNNDNIDKLADYANAARLDITGDTATTLSVVSGGTEVKNTLNYVTKASSGNDLLTSVTVTGTQNLTLNVDVTAGTNKLATVDASGQTAGGLVFDMAKLTATGTLKLGAGDDAITLNAAANYTTVTDGTAIQHVSGFGLGSAAGLTTQKGFDEFVSTGGVQAAAVTAAASVNGLDTILKGLYTFGGAGPANLGAAVAEIGAQLSASATASESVVFKYAGLDYVYVEGTGATNGQLVQLTGLSTATGLDATAAGHLYLV